MHDFFVFIVKKKQIIISIILIFIILFIYIFFTKYYVKDSVEVISLPSSNKTIVLDAGHGYPDRRRSFKQWNK